MKLITKNKKAYFDYDIIDSFEAWIELKWYEVKSIRQWQVNLKWSYFVFHGDAMYVKSMHVSAWKAIANKSSIETDRERKVFLHKKDLDNLSSKSKEKWISLIPLELYFKWSLIKIKVWLAKWKKAFQKKQVLKERTMQKEARIAASKYIR